MLVFVSEICCTIIPTALYLAGLIEYVYSMTISQIIVLGHDIDGFITILIYWHTRSRKHTITRVIGNSVFRSSNLSHHIQLRIFNIKVTAQRETAATTTCCGLSKHNSIDVK